MKWTTENYKTEDCSDDPSSSETFIVIPNYCYEWTYYAGDYMQNYFCDETETKTTWQKQVYHDSTECVANKTGQGSTKEQKSEDCRDLGSSGRMDIVYECYKGPNSGGDMIKIWMGFIVCIFVSICLAVL